MRVSLLVVVVFALVSGCSPSEPDDVAAVSELPAPEPEQADNLPELLGTVRQVQVQAEEECRRLVESKPGSRSCERVTPSSIQTS